MTLMTLITFRVIMGSCPKLGAKNAWESSGKLKAKVPIRCSRGGGVDKHHIGPFFEYQADAQSWICRFPKFLRYQRCGFHFLNMLPRIWLSLKLKVIQCTNVMIEAVYLFCKQKQKQGSVPPKSQIQNASTEKVLHAPHFSRIVSPFLGSKE